MLHGDVDIATELYQARRLNQTGDSIFREEFFFKAAVMPISSILLTV
jgi:hypothetical protein